MHLLRSTVPEYIQYNVVVLVVHSVKLMSGCSYKSCSQKSFLSSARCVEVVCVCEVRRVRLLTWASLAWHYLVTRPCSLRSRPAHRRRRPTGIGASCFSLDFWSLIRPPLLLSQPLPLSLSLRTPITVLPRLMMIWCYHHASICPHRSTGTLSRMISCQRA